MAKDAMNRVIERASINGVPKEVRRVTPESGTRFLRPMPGASRMYPETDIPPMTLSKIDVEIPKTLDQRETEVPLNSEESKQIVSRNLDAKFYELIRIYDNPKIISRLLLHTLPSLESEKNVIIGKEAITQVLNLAKYDKITKEGIENALLQASKGKEIELKNENIEAEVREFISNLINEKLDFVKERGMGAIGPLMGLVMNKLAGSADGKSVSKILREKISEII